MAAVVSQTAESNAVSDYFVSCLAGPRIGRVRVFKGETLRMSEYQARALLLSGELVADKALVDDPFGEAAAAAAAEKVAADAKAAADKAAAEAKKTTKAADPVVPPAAS